jgi:hypothetical protein
MAVSKVTLDFRGDIYRNDRALLACRNSLLRTSLDPNFVKTIVFTPEIRPVLAADSQAVHREGHETIVSKVNTFILCHGVAGISMHIIQL